MFPNSWIKPLIKKHSPDSASITSPLNLLIAIWLAALSISRIHLVDLAEDMAYDFYNMPLNFDRTVQSVGSLLQDIPRKAYSFVCKTSLLGQMKLR